LLKIDATIPATDRVVVAWVNPPNSYVFFWSTYWLYPRKVTIINSIDGDKLPPTESLVSVHLPTEPEPNILGYDRVMVYRHSDLIVTLYRRAG
jgi:hypothetical protein